MDNSRITDDGFTHSLLVLQDVDTGGFRLQACVYEDELRKCPIWTAFGNLTDSPLSHTQSFLSTAASLSIRITQD